MCLLGLHENSHPLLFFPDFRPPVALLSTPARARHCGSGVSSVLFGATNVTFIYEISPSV